MATIQDLGLVTSYGYARAGGYQGSVEQYERYLANLPTYAQDARDAADDAEESATLSKSWAVGDTGGTRPDEDTNNAKYWCDQAAAVVGLDVFEGATASENGKRGLVPGPGAGMQNNVLFGDATWKQLYFTFIGTTAEWAAISNKSFYKIVVLTDD